MASAMKHCASYPRSGPHQLDNIAHRFAQAIRLVKVNQLHAFASQETKKQIEHHAFRHQAAGLSCEFGLHSDNRLTVSKQTMYVFQREYATHREGSA